jgi:hypothetical protein
VTGQHVAFQLAAGLTTFPIAKLPRERNEVVATQTASQTVHQHAVRAVAATPTTTGQSRSVPQARSADRHSVRRAELAHIARIAAWHEPRFTAAMTRRAYPRPDGYC